FEEIKTFTNTNKILRAINKIDLNPKTDKKGDVHISALTGEGIEELFSKLKNIAAGDTSYTEKSSVVSNVRHYNCLKKAKENLQRSLSSILLYYSGEFIYYYLYNAVINLVYIIIE